MTETFAEEVRRRREEANLSQVDLGQRAGRSWQTIHNIETGRSKPRGTTIRSIDRALRSANRSAEPSTHSAPVRPTSHPEGSSMSEIQFVDELPDDGRSHANIPWGTDIAPLLKERPGQWALIQSWERTPCPAQSRASTIRSGGSTPWRPKRSFEAAIRKMPNGEMRLYARYVGDEFRADAAEETRGQAFSDSNECLCGHPGRAHSGSGSCIRPGCGCSRVRMAGEDR